jgi:hypothetical protein
MSNENSSEPSGGKKESGTASIPRSISTIVFIVALCLFATATLLVFLERPIASTSIVYGAAALCLVFTFLPWFDSFKAFGVEGKLKARILGIEQDISLIQKLTFAAAVSKFEVKHLKGLTADKYTIRYNEDVKSELKRLDAFGFLFPNPGMGLNSLDPYLGSGQEFDLKQYVHVTAFGMQYIQLARELDLPERP